MFRGTAVLAAANLTTKLLGFVLYPVITRIFRPHDGHGGNRGAGLAGMPIATYQIIYSFTSAGFNLAIAKLVAERLAVGDVHGARRLFHTALNLMAALGLIFTVVLWWGAPTLAAWVGEPQAAPGFRAMAPAMTLMTFTAAYRGLFQGFQFHTPNGVSQMVEQGVRVAAAIGLLLVWVRVSVPLGAAAVNAADVPGALAAMAYLYWQYRRERRQMWRGLAAPPAGVAVESAGQVLRRIFAIALPMSLIGAIAPLMIQADTVMVNHLLRQAGQAEADVQAAFGQLRNATSIILATSVVSSALYMSLVPAVAEALARGRLAEVRRTAAGAYLVTLVTGLPITAGLWALGEPLYRLIFGAAGGGVLAAVAGSALFLMLQQTSSGLLQGAGRVSLTVANQVAGLLAKIALTYVLMGPLHLGIAGAALATVLAYAVMALLNLWGVHRHLGAAPDWAATALKPALATVGMLVTLGLLQRALPATGAPATLALAAAGAGVYGLALLLLRGLPAETLGALPGGGRLVAVLQRLGLL